MVVLGHCTIMKYSKNRSFRLGLVLQNENWGPLLFNPAFSKIVFHDFNLAQFSICSIQTHHHAFHPKKKDSLEDISYLEGNVKKELKIAADEKEAILSNVPAELRENGSALYADLVDGKLDDMNMDEASEEVAVQLAAHGVIGKRVDEMESGFMMALDYMIFNSVFQSDNGTKVHLPGANLNGIAN